MTRPAVFLDRDGVLNEAVVDDAGVPHPPAALADVRLVADAEEACRRLREAGYLLVVVTNQPDVARGKATRVVVESINELVREHLGIDDVRVCFHDDADGCDCRKPEPGLPLAAGRDLAIDLAASVLVGDRGTDIEAGRRAGCKTVLLQTPYSDRNWVDPSFVTNSLSAAAEWILSGAAEEMA